MGIVQIRQIRGREALLGDGGVANPAITDHFSIRAHGSDAIPGRGRAARGRRPNVLPERRVDKVRHAFHRFTGRRVTRVFRHRVLGGEQRQEIRRSERQRREGGSGREEEEEEEGRRGKTRGRGGIGRCG